MGIIIDNVNFPFDFGCKVLKLKYTDCPMEELKDFWNDIVPANFKEICSVSNLEQRRIGILYLGINNIVKEVNPTLVSEKTIEKNNTWVDDNGELVSFKLKDTYKLFKVDGSYFSENLSSNRKMEDVHYVSCKDTSTDREYLIWVDVRSVYTINNENSSRWDFDIKKVNAIACVAWTITTNIPKGQIEKIIRQGDCILIKPKENYETMNDSFRHLTEKEYKELLVSES